MIPEEPCELVDTEDGDLYYCETCGEWVEEPCMEEVE